MSGGGTLTYRSIGRRVIAGAITPSPAAALCTASAICLGRGILEREVGGAGAQYLEDVLSRSNVL
jgi:hypothetical protein